MSGGPSEVTTATRVAEWDFGAYPYGLEPLHLPEPDDLDRDEPDAAADAALEHAARRLGHATAWLSQEEIHLADRDTLDDVFWFRWITGHQISFLLWHLMARVLARLPEPEPEPGPPSDAPSTGAELLAGLAEGYNAMMLYTSSCTRDSYERVIRPAMHRHHHGFSGSWAPDYRPVRRLFHGRVPGTADGLGNSQLEEALRVNHVVHGAVAARLVPGSESLLQQSVGEMRLQDRAVRSVFYDHFFLTVRRPVTERQVLDQLLRRLRAALIDVSLNGLYPYGEQTFEGLPPTYRTPFIGECEHRFPSITARTAQLTCGFAGPSSAGRHTQGEDHQ
ncbi:hypothetical protein [Streptomyces sp. NPDC047071]|uniref:hypothetical protein n=1 Tax=Streptomyces sp. NPDC047071 TaxID=3154808 RepID=UPI0034545F31